MRFYKVICNNKLFKLNKIAFFLALVLSIAVNGGAYAMGNHPESNTCPADKPYYVFCSDSIHGLKGWYGACYATRQEAEKAAVAHAQQQHNGNTRWTGVAKVHPNKY